MPVCVDLKSSSSGVDANDRCDVRSVISHAESVIESCPDLGVKLEGPLNYKEWYYEFDQLLSRWDTSFRHYYDQKIDVDGAVLDEIKNYYAGASRKLLRLMLRKIDLALRNVVLNNLKEDKLHFHATPDGNHDFHDLMVQVKKACVRDPLMTKVGELRSIVEGFECIDIASRNVRIYGTPDWKLEVVAGVVDTKNSDERFLRKVIKTVEESKLDEDFHQIKRQYKDNFDILRERTNLVIDKLVALVEDASSGRGNGLLILSSQQRSSILLDVRKRLTEGNGMQGVQPVCSSRATSASSRSSNSEIVVCEFLYSTAMSYHTVSDSSLLRDVREEEIFLHSRIPALRTKIGYMEVEFPGGYKFKLNNVAYLPGFGANFSDRAAMDDGIEFSMRGDDIFIANSGRLLCTRGLLNWIFDLKIERQIPSCPTLRILNIKPLPRVLRIVKHSDEDDDGIDRSQPPQAQEIQRAQLKLHRQFGHPDIKQFRRLKKILPMKSNKSFSPELCKACCLSKPKTQFPDASGRESFIQRPLEVTHIGIYESFKTPFDSSHFILTMVDEHTKYSTVHLLTTKAEAIQKIDEYFSTYSKLFGTTWRHISHDRDPELGPQINDFCKRKQIHLLPPETLTLCGSETIAERWRKVIMDKAKCLLTDAQAPTLFWPAAVRTAVNQINLCPMLTLNYDTPFDNWKSFATTPIERPRLAVFGSTVWYTTSTKRRALGCYLGPSPTKSRHIILSHYLAQIIEVADFEEEDKFFFKTFGLELSGKSKDEHLVDFLKLLIKKPSSFPIDIENDDDEYERKLAEISELSIEEIEREE